jgi:hypothetical protein
MPFDTDPTLFRCESLGAFLPGSRSQPAGVMPLPVRSLVATR